MATQEPPIQSTSAPAVVPEVQTPKKSNLPLILLGILLLVLVGAGGIFLGIQMTKRELVPSPLSIETSPSPVVDPTANWQTFEIKNLGLAYQLPSQIVSQAPLEEIEVPGETGTALYIRPRDYKVLGVNNLLMGTTSLDYSAGRGGIFLDLQGFVKQNDKYSVKFVGDKSFVIPSNLVTELQNPNGIQIIKIKGANVTEGEITGMAISGTPGEGRLGALLNVDKSPYQGLAIQMTLSSELTEQLFDQILSTFRFVGPMNSREGESCGEWAGPAGNAKCAPGLTCKYDVQNENKIGTCVK